MGYTLLKIGIFVYTFFSIVGFLLLVITLGVFLFKRDVLLRYENLLRVEKELAELKVKYAKIQKKVEKIRIMLGSDMNLPEVEYPLGALPIYVQECDTPCALPAVGPILRGLDFEKHTGVDIDVPESTFVFSTANGTVKDVGWDSLYGLFVEIRHSRGYTTLYAHLSKSFVKKGDTVKTGQIIGLSGKTGKTTGYHIHYEVRRAGKPVDPMEILP